MLNIETLTEFKDLLASEKEKLIVVDFFATWCGPCRQIAPRLVEMEKEFTSAIFCKVDVDEAAEVAENEDISAMPTFKLYKKGAMVAEQTGANESGLRDLISTHIL
ncbi:thioredoxin-like [Argonauta hians]